MMTIQKLTFSALLLMMLFAGKLDAQQPPAWDDTNKSSWPPEMELVGISSSADGTKQKAYVYRSKNKNPQPLIISLHTWSGDYTQHDPLVSEILARGYNYIHPDFRGPNNTPSATGSKLVVADIEDAIRFAVKYTNADPQNVHVIGVSGGGMATLLAYMNITYPVKSFSAWAPISDVEAFYWESIGRKQKYAGDVLRSVSSDSVFNAEEALRRSPLAQKFPIALRKGSGLFIYEGVHDGYTGSVPITHSINMYNRLVGELKYSSSSLPVIMEKARDDRDLVSEQETISMVTRRYNPAADPKEKINDRAIYLYRHYGDISLTLFEGGHEQLPIALSLVPIDGQSVALKRNIFTLGDSNGQMPGGWVDQLRLLLPASDIFNISKSGNTIGFDNGGEKQLNTLRNIDQYISDAKENIGRSKYDYFIFCLGTNDAKAEFAGKQEEVIANFEKLIGRIKANPYLRRSKPRFVFVTPPPIGTKGIQEKYKGGNERLSILIPKVTEIAQKNGFTVVDIYSPLQQAFEVYAPDGVHMSAAGQKIIAQRILASILQLEQKPGSAK